MFYHTPPLRSARTAVTSGCYRVTSESAPCRRPEPGNSSPAASLRLPEETRWCHSQGQRPREL